MGLEVKLLLSPEPPLPTVLVSRAGWEVALVVQKGGALAQGRTEQLQHQTAWGGEEGQGRRNICLTGQMVSVDESRGGLHAGEGNAVPREKSRAPLSETPSILSMYTRYQDFRVTCCSLGGISVLVASKRTPETLRVMALNDCSY